ncbi:MAG: choline kinase [Planctomycetota bacterium]|jgi:choline kinase
MNALILAAGRGSRMTQLTDDRPKCLVELHGRALLDWQLDALRSAGIDQVAILTGYRAGDVNTRADASFHNPRWQETNMVQTLACAREWLCAAPCVVSYSDIVYPASAVESLLKAEAELALTYDPKWLDLWSRRFEDPLDDAESFKLDAAGNLLEIGSRADSCADIEGQFMGLLRFTPASWARVETLLASLPPKRADRLDTTAMLNGLLRAGEVIEPVAIDGPWGEADSASDLAVLESLWPKTQGCA